MPRLGEAMRLHERMTHSKPNLMHRIEFVAALLAIKLFRVLGPRLASNLGGTVLRTIGPFIRASKTADANLIAAMPELSARERRTVLAATWDNLGRTAAEMPHIGRLRETASGAGYRFTGAQHLDTAASGGGPYMMFTGHIGNWELLPSAVGARGLEFAFMYRTAKNPLVDALIQKMRLHEMGTRVSMFAKGGPGTRRAYGHLVGNGGLGMLIDQKLNEGIAVPFFNMKAMTAPGMATFALKFRCPVVPVHVVRDGPARFNIICEPPLVLPDTGDRTADTLSLMTTSNLIMERWIREAPGSWLWLHRRWPKTATLA